MIDKKAILENASDFYRIYLDDITGKKMIQVYGYYYDNGEDDGLGTSRYVEYSDFVMPLAEFLDRELYLDSEYDFYQERLKQYITDMTEEEALEDMDGVTKELKYTNLSIDTPCGEYVNYESESRPQNGSVSDEYTVWFAVKLRDKSQMGDLTEHLSMNGYTFDTNGIDTVFIFEEEIDYVETILHDHGVEYDRL